MKLFILLIFFLRSTWYADGLNTRLKCSSILTAIPSFFTALHDFFCMFSDPFNHLSEKVELLNGHAGSCTVLHAAMMIPPSISPQPNGSSSSRSSSSLSRHSGLHFDIWLLLLLLLFPLFNPTKILFTYPLFCTQSYGFIAGTIMVDVQKMCLYYESCYKIRRDAF